MKRALILLLVLLAASIFLHAKRTIKITPLKDNVKKVYVSVEAQSMFNFLENLKYPNKNSGITFCVTPSIRVDYYLGSYFFVGGGLAFNTTGGDHYFISSRFDNLEGFKASQEVRRIMSVSYVEMPLYAKVQSNYMDNWAVQGLLGFSWGVKVMASRKDTYSEFTYSKDNVEYLNGAYEETDKLRKKASLFNVAGIVEVRALYRATNKLQLFVGTGYQGGLVNILSKKYTGDEEFHKGKPGQVIVSAGIVF
ncbi:MAG: PorT family protein [Bacteroidales bacterium]|jgi:hypothetical protein|nr:PorT family protein [Bacteroidales bacterium]